MPEFELMMPCKPCNLAATAIAVVLSGWAASASAYQCPSVPPPTADIAAVTRYDKSDRSGESISDDNLRANDETLSGLRQLMHNVSYASDAAYAGDASAVGCIKGQLRAWAQAGGLLGKDSGPQARYERSWALASIGLSIVKARSRVPVDDPVVRDWLRAVAERVRGFAEYRESKGQQNNLYDWALLAVGVTGDLIGDRGLWGFATDRLTWATSAQNIDADGLMKQEMGRGTRAQAYHGFAAKPLTVLAAYARARKFELPPDNLRNLTRLMCNLHYPAKMTSRITAKSSVEQKALPEDQTWQAIFWSAFPELGVNDVRIDPDSRIFYLGGKLAPLIDILRHDGPAPANTSGASCRA